MKRWSAIFFLLIALLGSFIPCCGIDDCCADQVAKSTNQRERKPEGTCSPFFACATCPGFVQSAKSVQVIQPGSEKPVHHEGLFNYHLSSYATSFWQPPRLG